MLLVFYRVFQLISSANKHIPVYSYAVHFLRKNHRLSLLNAKSYFFLPSYRSRAGSFEPHLGPELQCLLKVKQDSS